MAGKVRNSISEAELQQDLEKYRTRAIALGATDARIITTDMVMIDERVRAKCIYPKCGHFGTSVNCPPHSMEPEQTRILVVDFPSLPELQWKLLAWMSTIWRLP